MGFHNAKPPDKAYPKAKKAAQKAIRLGGAPGEAYTSLAWYYMYYKWDWDEAKKAFEKAIKLNPGYVYAHIWYREYYLIMGQWDDAITEMKKCLRLGPLGGRMKVFPIVTYGTAGRYTEAEKEYKKAARKYPKDPSPHLFHAKNLGMQGKFKESYKELNIARGLTGNKRAFENIFGYYYAYSGQHKKADKILRKLIAQHAQGKF